MLPRHRPGQPQSPGLHPAGCGRPFRQPGGWGASGKFTPGSWKEVGGQRGKGERGGAGRELAQ